MFEVPSFRWLKDAPVTRVTGVGDSDLMPLRPITRRFVKINPNKQMDAASRDGSWLMENG